MIGRVLFVDDEPHVIDGIRRQIGRKVEVVTATSGDEALRLIREGDPFAVVVSDMRMPQMNGTQLLASVREMAPDTVRMILSGQSDLQQTIDAVNEGQVFRFLTKPCSPELLWKMVETGIEQYRLVNAERELLEKTLNGAVKTLVELVGLANPVAYERAARIKDYAEAIAEALGVGSNWQLRLATILSQLGCIALPAELLTKVHSGTPLDASEQQLYQSHPELGARLIREIPRLDPVARMIAAQMKRPHMDGTLQIAVRWDATQLGAIILRVATELDQLVGLGLSPQTAAQKVVDSWPELPPVMADSLSNMRIDKGEIELRLIELAELAPGMIVDEDLKSRNGIRLVPQGHEITEALMVRLSSVAAGVGVCEPFRVRVQV
jgi:CheY-like chemotaxis protein